LTFFDFIDMVLKKLKKKQTETFLSERGEEMIDFDLLLVYLPAIVVPLVLLVVPGKALLRGLKMLAISPNMVSVLRVPMYWMGFSLIMHTIFNLVGILFLLGCMSGITMMSLAIVLDNTDGKSSRANGPKVMAKFSEGDHSLEAFFAEFYFFGKTKMGEWLDPLADKSQYLPVWAALVAMGHLSLIPLVVAILPEIAGTLIRPPFITGQPVWLNQVAAKWQGKTKTVCFFTGLSLVILQVVGVLTSETVLPDLLMGCGAVLAWWSVLAKLDIVCIINLWRH